MFIAFEGPDNTGKSTGAAQLATDGHAIYNATKEEHQVQQQRLFPERDLVVTYDRIDWFTHMVYRLALPDREWNDARPRTVFAMPDTHLVVKLHRPDLANFKADEEVDTPIAVVNQMYYYFADYFTGLNQQFDYMLFKTISIIEVANETGLVNNFSQKLVSFDSPVVDWSEAEHIGADTNEQLLELLRYEDHRR